MEEQEYELKKAELALREREVAAKEKEGKTSKWFNPVTIAICVAAIGLFGNIVTNILSNHASSDAERVRAQSNLVLSVIKTSGNEDETCKNLNFFVRIGWLDDPNGAIHKSCGTKGEGGVPTLPATSNDAVGFGVGGYGVGGYGGISLFGVIDVLTVRVDDADSHKPIAKAKVDVEQSPQQQPILGLDSSVPQKSVPQSIFTDVKGDAILTSVNSFNNLTVSKDGYVSVTQPMTQGVVSGSASHLTVLIDLQRTPTKH